MDKLPKPPKDSPTKRLYVDQYGHHYWANSLTDLKVQLGYSSRKHSNPMYITRKGITYMVGYVIGEYWLDVYDAVYVKV